MALTRTFTVVPVVRWVVRESTSSENSGSSGELAELRNEQDAHRVAKAMTDASAPRSHTTGLIAPAPGLNTLHPPIVADGRCAGQEWAIGLDQSNRIIGPTMAGAG